MVIWIDLLILLAVLADILVWYLDRKKQNLRDEKYLEQQKQYLELQKQVVELLQDSNAELADIRDVTVDGPEESGK